MNAKEWKKKVCVEPKNGYERLSAEERERMNAYCTAYKAFLDAGKTERECVQESGWPRRRASAPTSGAWRSRPGTGCSSTTAARC